MPQKMKSKPTPWQEVLSFGWLKNYRTTGLNSTKVQYKNMAIKNNISKKQVVPQTAGFRWLIVISIIFFELLCYAWVRTETTQTMLRISKAERRLIENQSYQTALLLEIDRLKSEDRITKIASSKLNLSRDLGTNTYYLSKDSM